MTEDDTFDALRRDPYKKIHRRINTLFDWSPYVSMNDFILEDRSGYHSSVQLRDRALEESGWTQDEFYDEFRRVVYGDS